MSSQNMTDLQAEVARLQTELHALKDGHEEIAISDYLLTRLAQLGVKVSVRSDAGGLYFPMIVSFSICLVCLGISI
jgi:hypothetical protein